MSDLYLLVPLTGLTGSVAAACVFLARDPGHATNRTACRAMLGVALWAGCELAWNTRETAEAALFWARASALGWAPLAPSALAMLAALLPRRDPRADQILRVGYAVSLGFVVLTWASPWVVTGMVATPWGWSNEFGWGFVFFYAFLLANLGYGAVIARRAVRALRSPVERQQGRWVGVAVAVPMVSATVTDVLLPSLGVHPPRIGTASFAFLGLVLGGNYAYYGYSLAAPGAFAQEILGTLRDGVAFVHLDGIVRSCNQGLAQQVGLRVSEILGRSIQEFVPSLGDDLDPELSDYECLLETHDGASRPVSIGTTPLRDRRGHRIGLVVAVRDLSEVVNLRTRLITSGRLAAVGELAASIAHEINNPMAFIRSNLTLLASHWKRLSDVAVAARPELEEVASEGEELVAESLEGVDRAVAFVRDIKGFSHAGGGRRELVDLNILLDGAVRVAAPQIRRLGCVERRYAELPPVWCAQQEIKQVFLNLLINAAQALDASGTIRIETRAEPDAVVAEIEDDGAGISAEHIERIFDPFFTTKPVGEGTGLGLAISYEIVRRHRGSFDVDSQPGRGTRIAVRLPIEPVDAEAANPDSTGVGPGRIDPGGVEPADVGCAATESAAADGPPESR